MIAGKFYTVIKEVKIHTKPTVLAKIIQVGKFVKETKTSYIFNEFRVKKSNVISIKEA